MHSFTTNIHNLLVVPILSDIDECSTSSDLCHPQAVCTNTDGSYTCMCVSGYTGDGQNCSGKQSHVESFYVYISLH